MNIRYAKKEDLNQIIELCEAHAIFEKSAYSTINKSKSLSEILFESSNGIKCLVVEKDKLLVGYATFMKQFSTWDANFYIYLDCLYLKENARKEGIGYKIMCQVRDYAISQNCKTIQWQTPDDNIKTIKFYKKLGASAKTKERFLWENFSKKN